MPRARLWPAVLVLVLGALFILKTWLTGDAIRQIRIMRTSVTLVLTLVALLVWLLFLSRLARRVRLVAFAVALGLIALASAPRTQDGIPLLSSPMLVVSLTYVLLAAGAIATLVQPWRGPHDRVARTWVIPR